MLERQRARRRRLIAVALVVATLVLGTAAAITLAPMLGGLNGGGNPPPPPPDQKVPMHIHVSLALFRDGQKATLPGDIGQRGGHWVDHSLDHLLDLREGAAGSLSPLHTHDSSGTIHVEASETYAFTLGEFFAVWGQPVGPVQTVDLIPDDSHTLTMTVNGENSTAWGSLVLHDGDAIEIHYTTL